MDAVSEAAFESALIGTPEPPPAEPIQQADGHKDTPSAQDPPAKVEPTPEAKPEVKAESDRNPDGTFKKKVTNAEARHDPIARVEQAIARQREAERRADAAERKALDLEAKSKKTPEVETPAAKFAAWDTWSAEHADASYEDYLDARADFRLEQRESAKKQTETATKTTADADARFKAYDQKIAAETAKDADWLEQIDPALRALVPISALREGETPTFGNVISEAILRSDHPVGLLKHFTAHPEDSQRLSTLPPDAFFRALGTIEARLDAATPGPAPVVISHAKSPITPVGNSPSTSDEPSDDESVEKFIARENAAERKRQR